MCSGFEAGSHLRLIDFVYHSALGLRVIKKKKQFVPSGRRFSAPLVEIEKSGVGERMNRVGRALSLLREREKSKERARERVSERERARE